MKYEQTQAKRIQFVTDGHPAGEDDKKAPNFYKAILKDSEGAEKPKIAFIVVAHLVHTLPYFLEALSLLGDIAVLIPKASRYVPSVVNSIRHIYKELLCPEVINKRTLSSDNSEDREQIVLFFSDLVSNPMWQDYKFMIIDHGGYFETLMNLLALFSERIAGVIEHTWNGEIKYQTYLVTNQQFPIPVYSIARLEAKAHEDSAVASSIILAIHAKISSGEGFNQILNRVENIGIIGYGHMGKAIALRLKNEMSGQTNIRIVDSFEPAQADALTQFQHVTNNAEDMLKVSDLIIVATSSHAFDKKNLEKLKSGTCIICVTSSDDLIHEDVLTTFYERLSSPDSLLVAYQHKEKNQLIYLAANGCSLNFTLGSTAHPILHLVLASVCASAWQLMQNILNKDILDLSKIYTIAATEKNLQKIWEDPSHYGSLQDLETSRQQLFEHLMRDQWRSIEESTAVKLQGLKERALHDSYVDTLLTLYIEPKGTRNVHTSQSFELYDETQKFLTDPDKKVMLLLAEPGEGKSTFNLYLRNKLWQLYDIDKNNPIPVHIYLPSLQNPRAELLQEYFRTEEFSIEELAVLHAKYSFVFILDSYDEMNETPNLYMTNKLSTWRGKSIISCRTRHLTQLTPSYQYYFMPTQHDQLLQTAFEELTILPFSDHQIDSYIAKYIATSTDEFLLDHATYLSHIHNLPHLIDLIRTPFLLMIALNVMSTIVKKYQNGDIGQDGKIKNIDLYAAFMQQSFEKYKIRALANPSVATIGWHDIASEFQKTAENLATEMYHANVIQVRYQTGEQQDNPYESYFASFDFDQSEIISINSADLNKIVLKENKISLIYVMDCHKQVDQWRIVARNNAGGQTYHPRSGWLSVSELIRRWSVRNQSILEHQEKTQRLNEALALLNSHIPPTPISDEIKEKIFFAIAFGLTHPWHKFFDLDNPRTKQLLSGIPIVPGRNNRGLCYAFLHAELLNYFSAKGMHREERKKSNPLFLQKPWLATTQPLPAPTPILGGQSALFPAAAIESPASDSTAEQNKFALPDNKK